MTHGFRRTRHGVAAELGGPERQVLVDLIRQTEQLLAQDAPEKPAAPSQGEGDEFETLMRQAGFGPGTGTAEDIPVTPPAPADPAVRRLLPDAHREDAHAAGEFRRLAGDAVRDRKRAHLRRAAEAVESAGSGRVRLAEEEAVSLLIALTDVRLVLGSRLGLDDDESAEGLSDRLADMDQEDPLFSLALGYEFLTWLQETLAVALTP